MRYRSVRRAERYIGLAVAAGMSTAASAQGTETSTAVFVSSGASVETNPYNVANAGGESIALTADVRPVMRIRTEQSTIDLGGQASFRQFLRRYGLEDNYSADASINTRMSERVTLYSSAGFNYSKRGYDAFARPGLLPGAPVTPNLPDPSIIDPSVLGARTRTKSLNVTVGGSARLNTYSSVSASVSGRAMRFGQIDFGNFNNVSGQLSYSHQLSERVSVGIVGSLSKTDYLNRVQGDARTTSIMASFDRRLGPNWTLSASAGMAFTRIDQALGLLDVKYSSFTMQGSFCRQGEFSRLCFTGSRSPEPSALGSVRVSNVLQVDYSRRISDSETVTVTGAYAHTNSGRGALALIDPAVTFLSGGLRYDKRLRERLTFYASTNASKVSGDGSSRRANFGVSAGLQFRFGALQ